MLRQKVNSGLIVSLGYDQESRTLQIEFKTGSIWDYLDVPQDVYDELITSDSVGKYFLSNIKGKYEEHNRS